MDSVSEITGHNWEMAGDAEHLRAYLKEECMSWPGQVPSPWVGAVCPWKEQHS
jgi:hypothetical protein